MLIRARKITQGLPGRKMNMEGFPATGGGPRRARPTQWTAGTAQMEPSDPRRGRRRHDILRQREVADTEDPREGARAPGHRGRGRRGSRRVPGRGGNDGRHGLKPSTEPNARQAMLAPPYVLEPARRLLGGIDALSFIYQLPIVGLPDSYARTTMPVMRTPRRLGRYHVDRGFRSVDGGDCRRLR